MVGPEVTAHFFRASPSDIDFGDTAKVIVPVLGPGVLFTLVEKPPFVQSRTTINPGSVKNRDQCLALVPVRVARALVPVRLGALVPVRGTNRDQSSRAGHVACRGALVPVRVSNRD